MATTPINGPSNTSGVSSLLSTQSAARTSKAATNRNTALTATQKSASLNARTPINITLNSTKSPPTNLPRGSIVDKLV